MKKIVCYTLLCLPINGFAVTVLGATPCTDFMKDAQQATISGSYVTGFISGYAVYRNDDFWGRSNKTRDEMLAKVTGDILGFCLKNPDKNIADAAVHIIENSR